MYNIAICDDDIEYIKKLESIILDVEKRIKVRFHEFVSGIQLMSQETDSFDAIFLDIMMNEMDGNKIAVMLNKADYRGVIVQISGIFNPTPETIKISPYRYLLKNYDDDVMKKEIKEVFDEVRRKSRISTIEGSYRRDRIVFSLKDVNYFSAHTNGTCLIILKDSLREQYSEGNIIVNRTIKNLYDEYNEIDFELVSAGCMVNMSNITNFDIKNGAISLEDEVIYVARRKKKEFFSRFMEYSRRKYGEADI